MRIKRFVAISAVVVTACVGAATASQAAVTPRPAPSAATVAPADTAVEARLRSLVGVQPQAEIDVIAQSAAPAELLVDSATGEVIAAIPTPSKVRSFAVSWTSPGCGSSADACVYTNGGTTRNGFTGYGSILQFNLPQTKKFWTGAYFTALHKGNGAVTGAVANKTMTFTTPINFTAIGRRL